MVGNRCQASPKEKRLITHSFWVLDERFCDTHLPFLFSDTRVS